MRCGCEICTRKWGQPPGLSCLLGAGFVAVYAGVLKNNFLVYFSTQPKSNRARPVYLKCETLPSIYKFYAVVFPQIRCLALQSQGTGYSSKKGTLFSLLCAACGGTYSNEYNNF